MVLHGSFYSAPLPTSAEKREIGRRVLRTIGLTPKLEAAKRSEADTLVEAVVWA